MTIRKTALAGCALSLLGVMWASTSTSSAQPADYRTYFTFSAPVQLPGVTLPAGRYLFRLADPAGSRRVISVLSEDGRTPLAMLHTIPNRLLTAPQDAEVRFMETPADVPPAIKTWWYPGRSIGYEFIYPRPQAIQLATLTPEPVLTTSAETTELDTAELARVSRSGAPSPVEVLENPPPVEPTGRAQRGEAVTADSSPAAGAVAAVQSPVAVARSAPRTQLPQTASPVPGAMLFGGLAMFMGLGLALWRRPRS
jgi:hypothetical protein